MSDSERVVGDVVALTLVSVGLKDGEGAIERECVRDLVGVSVRVC